MLKYLEGKCYNVCNLLLKGSKREKTVGKMSTTGKPSSQGERYIDGRSLYYQVSQDKS